MLNYFPSYKIISRVIAFIAPLLVFLVYFLVTGTNPLTLGVVGGLVYLVMMLILLYLVGNAFSRKADNECEHMLALYNQECDPLAFVEAGKKVCRAIWEETKISGTTELGSWFMAPYALACLDATEDGEKDATQMEEALISNISNDLPSVLRAGILTNIEPLTLRLHGVEAALSRANEAQSLLLQDNTNESQTKMSYLRHEIPFLQTLMEGNPEDMLAKFKEVWESTANPMRMRVLYADAAAGIYASQGNIEQQRIALQFVIDNGNKLPSVEIAKRTLASL